MAASAGVPANTLALAGWAVALHLWFLPVYLLLTLLTPAMYAAHRRYGLAAPVAMVLLGVGIDALVINSHVKAVGWLKPASVAKSRTSTVTKLPQYNCRVVFIEVWI